MLAQIHLTVDIITPKMPDLQNDLDKLIRKYDAHGDIIFNGIGD